MSGQKNIINEDSVMGEEMIDLKDILREISSYYCWEYECDAKESSKSSAENKMSTLEKRYQYLKEYVLYRDIHEYRSDSTRVKSANLVPIQDVPVVAALLLRTASNKTKDKMFRGWLKANMRKCKIKVMKPKEVVELCSEIERMFEAMRNDPDYFAGFELDVPLRPDKVTCERWDSAIKSSLQYEYNYSVMKLHEKLDETLEPMQMLKPTIHMKDIEALSDDEYGDGSVFDTSHLRKLIMSDWFMKKEYESGGFKLNRNMTQGEYTGYLTSIFNDMEEHIKKNVLDEIVGKLKEKKSKGWKKVTDGLSRTHLASGELRRFENIYQLLKDDEELLQILTKKLNQDEEKQFVLLSGDEPLVVYTEDEILEYFHVGKR